MFDTFEPALPISCPWCGSVVTDDWQGKSGPCLLLHFRQGERHPVAHRVDEDVRFDPTRFEEFGLPDEFDLVGVCASGHFIQGVGRCRDGVWRETDISAAEEQAAGDAERERVRQVRKSLGY